MKIVKKEVYYCDYCNKRYLSKYHAKKHEDHCTLNPNRTCGVCGSSPGTIIDIIKKYSESFKITIKDDNYCFGKIETFEWVKDPVTEEEVLESVDMCPICALSVVRQSGLTKGYFNEKFIFHYKKYHDLWWLNIRKREWQNERIEMAR